MRTIMGSTSLGPDVRDLKSDGAPVDQQVRVLKKALKQWEHDFSEREGRKPTKKDILADPEIANKYKQYNKLKAEEKQNTGGAGDDDVDSANVRNSGVLHSAPTQESKEEDKVAEIPPSPAAVAAKGTPNARRGRSNTTAGTAPPVFENSETPVPRRRDSDQGTGSELRKESDFNPVAPLPISDSYNYTDSSSAIPPTPLRTDNETSRTGGGFRATANPTSPVHEVSSSTPPSSGSKTNSLNRPSSKTNTLSGISAAILKGDDLIMSSKAAAAERAALEEDKRSSQQSLAKNDLPSVTYNITASEQTNKIRTPTTSPPPVKSVVRLSPSGEASKPQTSAIAASVVVGSYSPGNKESEATPSSSNAEIRASREAFTTTSKPKLNDLASTNSFGRYAAESSESENNDEDSAVNSNSSIGARNAKTVLSLHSSQQIDDNDDSEDTRSTTIGTKLGGKLTALNKSVEIMNQEQKKKNAAKTESDAAAAAAAAAKVNKPLPDGVELIKGKEIVVRCDLFKRLPVGALLQCRVVRKRANIQAVFPHFEVFNDVGDQFLMSARKRKKSKSTNYIISSARDELTTSSISYIGKLKANFLGTEFVYYDARRYDASSEKKGLRNICSIIYNKKSLPREMSVAIPGVTIDIDQESMLSENVLEDHKNNNGRKLVFLKNKPPKWNESTKAHCLDFAGRVTLPSIKNFQLIHSDDDNYIVLQFGRIGEEAFTMDVRYPLSPIEAFAICLTAFDAYDSA